MSEDLHPLGDTMRGYIRQAHEDDWRRASERLVAGMPTTMKALGDVIPAALGHAETDAADPRRALSSAELQWGAAVEHFRARRLSEGFGPNRVERDVAAARSSCERLRRFCESPIEHQIAPWLVCQNYGQWACGSPRAHVPKEDALPPDAGLLIIPQFAFARIRMDFALVAKLNEHLRIIAIECDGSAYHDVTKDFRRDQYLAGWNIPTVRATGIEVSRNPRSFAERVARLVLDWACPLGMKP